MTGSGDWAAVRCFAGPLLGVGRGSGVAVRRVESRQVMPTAQCAVALRRLAMPPMISCLVEVSRCGKCVVLFMPVP